jgi:eukaryotic-like serine/threonine-protein kinase
MGCLDEETILGLVEGTLAAPDRPAAERHLARCDVCRNLVARAAEALLSTGAVSATADGSELLRQPRQGEAVGRYRVTGFLGSGAMGVVVAAEDDELGREVALKLLRRDASRDSRQRFLREARAAAAIAHPGVVAVHDVLTTADGHPVLVMDRLHGETLRSLLERTGRLEIEQAVRIAREIASALEAAHARGVIHRDLKPENVFLSQREGGGADVKLLDFGVAKLFGPMPAPDAAGLTSTGTIVGTPYYMAPEQAFAERDLDARADLWSLGVILYECLSGRRPFSADSVGQVLRLLALGQLTPLREVVPGLPPRLLALIERLLSARELRPANAAEVCVALDALNDPPEPEPRRRSLRPALAITLALLALLGAGWLVVARGTAQPEPAATPEPVASVPVPVAAPEPGASPPVPTAAPSTPRTEPKRSARLAQPERAQPTAASSQPAADAGRREDGPGGLLTNPPF